MKVKPVSVKEIRGYEKLLHPCVHPTARTLFIRVLEELLSIGLIPVVVEVYRSPERQRMLYCQGRSDTALLAKGFSKAEIQKAREAGYTANKPRVTSTLNTMHAKGRAMDCIFVQNGVATYNLPESVWQTYGSVAKKHGLVWGGDWKTFPDRPHIEYRGE